MSFIQLRSSMVTALALYSGGRKCSWVRVADRKLAAVTEVPRGFIQILHIITLSALQNRTRPLLENQFEFVSLYRSPLIWGAVYAVERTQFRKLMSGSILSTESYF